MTPEHWDTIGAWVVGFVMIMNMVSLFNSVNV